MHGSPSSSAITIIFQPYFKHIYLDTTYFSQFGMGDLWVEEWGLVDTLYIFAQSKSNWYLIMFLFSLALCPRSVIFFISTLWLSPLPLSSSFQAFLLDCAERFQVFLWQHLWHRLRINYLCNNWKCQRMLGTFFFGFIYLLWNSGPPISNPVLIF